MRDRPPILPISPRRLGPLALSILLLGLGCSDEGDGPGFGDGTPGGFNPGGTPTATAATPQDTPPPTPQPIRQAEMPLQVADVVFTGDADGDGAGAAVAGIGDVNFDGHLDFAIGAPFKDARQPEGGQIALFFGGEELPWHVDLAEASASLDGEARGDRAGTAIAGGGDLNGDGISDLIVTAPGHSTGGIDAGRIYLLLGKAQGWFAGQRLGNADGIWDGLEGEGVGETGSVAMGGDLDGDGLGDLVLGAPAASTYAPETGHVRIVFGRADGWPRPASLSGEGIVIIGPQARARFGFSVAIHPDIDGDGIADLIVGAPRLEVGGGASFGAVYVFFGGARLRGGRLRASDADVVILGSLPGEELGASVTALGDVTGDGQADIAIGAWGNTSDALSSTRGRFYIVSDPLRDVTEARISDISVRLIGDAPGDFAGRPAIDPGDVNGDGRPDVLFGTYLRDYPAEDAGNAYLFYGWNAADYKQDGSLQETDVRFLGEGMNHYAAFALGAPGDLNGDGFDDLLIGAIGADSPTHRAAGRAYLVYGRPFFTE